MDKSSRRLDVPLICYQCERELPLDDLDPEFQILSGLPVFRLCRFGICLTCAPAVRLMMERARDFLDSHGGA